jgi:hypothetical protein
VGLGTSRPLLSHKLLVYLACGMLDILLEGCCSHGQKKTKQEDEYKIINHHDEIIR